GRIDVAGMMPQAPTSDTTGWFARDADTFARVSSVMLGEAIPDQLPRRLLIATDAFDVADLDTAAALQPLVDKLARPIGDGGAALRSAALGDDGIAHPHHLPVRAWRSDRRAACDNPRHAGRWASGWPVDHRRPRQRRDAHRHRPRARRPVTEDIMHVAFIGVGNMGRPMLANLLKKGFTATAYDIVPAALDAAVALGAA